MNIDNVLLEDIAKQVDILGLIIHCMAREKGFWEQKRNTGEAIALIHSELSEGLEALRHSDDPLDPAMGKFSDHIEGFFMIEEELADAIIRILDLGKGNGYDIPGALIAKIKFNNSRSHKHGKLF